VSRAALSCRQVGFVGDVCFPEVFFLPNNSGAPEHGRLQGGANVARYRIEFGDPEHNLPRLERIGGKFGIRVKTGHKTLLKIYV
jgi:hypothetical protein